MKTSEARKAALRVAIELYEQAQGELMFQTFEVEPVARALGFQAASDVQAIENYLATTGMMEHAGIGETPLRFTREGVAAIEASMDEPDQSHGPFPPMSVVVGDVHAGAQIAIGSGSFNQVQGTPGQLGEVMQLVQAALQGWPQALREQVSGAATALADEASAHAPDLPLARAALGKILKVAEQVGTGVATQTLIAYAKGHGWGP